MKDNRELLLAIRTLDIDDLILLSMLSSEKIKFREISEALSISRSAISHRLNKYKAYFHDFEIELTKEKKIFSPGVFELSRRASEALKIIVTMGESNVTTHNQKE